MAAITGVVNDIPDNSQQMGAPSFGGHEYKRAYIHFRNLNKIVQELRTLEKQVAELKSQLNK